VIVVLQFFAVKTTSQTWMVAEFRNQQLEPHTLTHFIHRTQRFQ